MARFPTAAVLTAMVTAMILTGHRTNPFDLEGSFTVQFNADDFAAKALPDPVASRDFTFAVTLQDAAVPSLHIQLVREVDGMRFEHHLECPRRSRNFVTLNANFLAQTKPQLRGRINGALFWDGFQGLLFARCTVPRPRPAVHPELQPSSADVERNLFV